MDITETLAPKSDQQNYDDYVTGPKTVTVSEVRIPGGDQPVEIHLVEFPGRPFKPSKTVRRIIVAGWGAEVGTYAGRRLTLYGDPSIKFGGKTVGGIRVSHMSNLDKPLTLSLTVTRGSRASTTIQPLPDAPDPSAPHVAALLASVTLDELQAAWQAAGSARVTGNPAVIAAKDKRKAELGQPDA